MVDEDTNNSLRRFHYRKILREILRACQNGDLDRIKTIFEKEGHRIRGWGSFGHEVSGDTVLHVAAQAGNMSIVKYLSKHTDEFKVNVKNKDMKTPLHCAAQFAREDVLKYLLENGAEVDALKRADWTPLMLACTKSGPTAHECIKALLAAKANASFRNKDGWPPLFIACRTGDEESVNILLKHWPEGIHQWTNNGRTVLHIAALHGHEGVIDLLVRANADVNAQDSSGSTPLREAVKHGNLDMVKCIIHLGADISLIDNIGRTILHDAALIGNAEIVEYIVKNNLIDVNHKDFFGITPVMIAHNHDVVKILIENGAHGKL
ncbi:hypothetical protein P5V15_014482 [Pogonomyrmex californicus]